MTCTTKKCSRCKETKPITEFNKNRYYKDGYQYQCKSCQLENNKEWAERRYWVRREALRRQGAKTKRDRGATGQKRSAHNAVYKALKSGEIERPNKCPVCGTTKSPIQAHHKDYSKPLGIEWMCARCHGRTHAKQRVSA